MKYTYQPKGVCCQSMEIELEDNIISNITFIGGCNGNGKGVAALCVGRSIDDIISTLSGITCKNKTTSCPDQLCKALSRLK